MIETRVDLLNIKLFFSENKIILRITKNEKKNIKHLFENKISLQIFF